MKVRIQSLIHATLAYMPRVHTNMNTSCVIQKHLVLVCVDAHNTVQQETHLNTTQGLDPLGPHKSRLAVKRKVLFGFVAKTVPTRVESVVT